MQLVKNASQGYVVEIYYSEKGVPRVVTKVNPVQKVLNDEPVFIEFAEENAALPVVFETKEELLPLIIDALADLSFEEVEEGPK